MIDEIDYFPRRDQQKKGKTAGEEWGKLKELKTTGKNQQASKQVDKKNNAEKGKTDPEEIPSKKSE
jgi:hypothetical protein